MLQASVTIRRFVKKKRWDVKCFTAIRYLTEKRELRLQTLILFQYIDLFI